MILCFSRPKNTILVVALSLLLGLLALPSKADDTALPARLNAALTLKIASYELHLSNQKHISILVLNDLELSKYLKERIGTKIGNSTLSYVNHDSDINNYTPDIIFVGQQNKLNNTLSYAHKNKVLTITKGKKLALSGVVLTLYDDEGIPGIILNLGASKENDLTWNPEILNFASTIK
jgi:hypothetical protein